jgi:hypothetical protein
MITPFSAGIDRPFIHPPGSAASAAHSQASANAPTGIRTRLLRPGSYALALRRVASGYRCRELAQALHCEPTEMR